MTRFSVIVTSASWERLPDLYEAIRGLREQTFTDFEVVVPVDGGGPYERAVRGMLGAYPRIIPIDDERGLAAARNKGAEAANGEIYVFLDDDAVPHESWLEELNKAYIGGAIAAGGPAMPDWPDGRPWYLHETFDWLVGAGPYHENWSDIRNTYGVNISFRADIFDDLMGFDEDYGKGSDIPQGEEAEFASRMRSKYGAGTTYNKYAVVSHRVHEDQLGFVSSVVRSYDQGATKAAMGLDDEESSALWDIITSMPSMTPGQIFGSVVLTTAVAVGYIVNKEWDIFQADR